MRLHNYKVNGIFSLVVLIVWSGLLNLSPQALYGAPVQQDEPTNNLYLPYLQSSSNDTPEESNDENLNGPQPTVKDRAWYFENWSLTQQDWDDWAKEFVAEDVVEPSSPNAIKAAAPAPPKLNLAEGQTAMQSSIGWDGVSGRAVDGSTDGSYGNRSIMHTSLENQPWWQVDLNSTYVLESVQLFGRTDCCADRLSDFYILISNNDMRGRSLSQLLTDPTVWNSYQADAVNGDQEFTTPTTGRFVRIQKNGRGYLQIAETRVYGKNLALGKAAVQSSTGWGGVAGRAVDGDIDGVYGNGSVSHTDSGNQQWWQLDLGQSHQLGRIWLFNRKDCCSERFAHFYVFASDQDMSGRSLDSLKNDPNVWQYLEVAAVGKKYLVAAGDAKGRYLRIQRNTIGYLSIAEVVVNGVPTSQASTAKLNPAEFGEWSDPIPWPHISVHASLLPNGKLLTWDATPDDFTPVFDPHNSPNNTTRATVWDPLTGVHADAQNANNTDIFCAGHNYLEDGRLFAAGGTTGYNKQIHATQAFDHASQNWTLTPTLTQPRWYPTVTDLANGNMLISGGRGNNPELYSPSSNSLQLYSGLTIAGSWPIIRQAPNGTILYAGGDVNENIYTVDLSGRGRLNAVNTNAPLESGASHAIYDIGKMLYVGGRGTDGSTRQSARILDLTAQSVSEATAMNYRRHKHNLTILADGSVMASGGMSNGSGLCNTERNNYAAEIWNPVTNQWAITASQDRPRQYHSTAVLLPDGRVWTGGHGYATKVSNQRATCAYQNTSEIFSPPYLFNANGTLAARPTISSAPQSAGYGTQFTLGTPNANAIRKVGLVKLSSVTHKLNMGQRYVPLTFNVATGQELRITTPANTNIATAGYYMLFIVNSNGTPSVSKMIRLVRDDGGISVPLIGLGPTSYKFDFGTNTSPVKGSWTQVTPSTNGGGVSWSGARISAVDRGSARGVNKNNQDLVYGTGASTLSVSTGNGTWRVTLVMGDRSFAHDNMVVRAEGQTINNDVDNAAGKFIFVGRGSSGTRKQTFDVVVNDGVLNIQLSDGGGSNSHWVLTRIKLEKVD